MNVMVVGELLANHAPEKSCFYYISFQRQKNREIKENYFQV
jgi:hypothetical protein